MTNEKFLRFKLKNFGNLQIKIIYKYLNKKKKLNITEGKIIFEKVYMKYRPHLNCILKELSFEIK